MKKKSACGTPQVGGKCLLSFSTKKKSACGTAQVGGRSLLAKSAVEF